MTERMEEVREKGKEGGREGRRWESREEGRTKETPPIPSLHPHVPFPPPHPPRSLPSTPPSPARDTIHRKRKQHKWPEENNFIHVRRITRWSDGTDEGTDRHTHGRTDGRSCNQCIPTGREERSFYVLEAEGSWRGESAGRLNTQGSVERIRQPTL